MDKDLLPNPTYAEAVTFLAEAAHWPRRDVMENVDLAYWQASAWAAKCKRVVEERGARR